MITTFTYQTINESLAKAKYEKNVARELKSANQFLLKRKGKKPSWFEGFLDSNKQKMIETICRATREEGIASLSGYREGYFNEIVQNANDLHCGNRISIETKIQGTKYTMSCKYKDNGFEISNIYGFLNREMSDKSSAAGQTGKFGIGIKSFFQFVDSLSIESNVNLNFIIERNLEDEESIPNVTGDVWLNENWDKKHTILEFTFDSELDSGFNIEKLITLCKYLDGQPVGIDSEEMFQCGKRNQLVFDICSLIFMGMDETKEAITSIYFKGADREIEITYSFDFDKVEQFEIDSEKWYIGKGKLQCLEDGDVEYEWEYLICHTGKYAFAYPLYQDEDVFLDEDDIMNVNNRFYSTYFLKEDVDHVILPMGLLIHSEYANMHRTDLGDSTESIKKALENIKDKMLMLFELFSSSQIKKSLYVIEISNVFHTLLYLYSSVSGTDYKESPLNLDNLTTEYLPKNRKGDTCSYVVYHNKNEPYTKSSYEEGDISEQLESLYYEIIEQDQVLDYSNLITDSEYMAGVRRIYYALMEEEIENEENYQRLSQMLNIFSDVKNFIAYRITGEKPFCSYVTDAAIDKWLLSWKKIKKKSISELLMLKLIGRYQLNDAIAYNGEVIGKNLSFMDYIFNDTLEAEGGYLSKLQTEQFGKKYKSLKKEMLENRIIDNGNASNPFMIRCIIPYGRSRSNWKWTFDYYNTVGFDAPKHKSFQHSFALLERLALEENIQKNTLCSYRGLYLYQSYALGFEYRENGFAYSYETQQQIIDMEPLSNIRLDSFSKYIDAVGYKKSISNRRVREYIKITCAIKSITVKELITSILPALMQKKDENGTLSTLLDFYDSREITFKNIKPDMRNEYPSENVAFIEKLTGYRIFLYRFDSGGKKNIVAYAHHRSFRVNLDSTKQFRDISCYFGNEKDIYIFYDNYAKNVFKAVYDVLVQIGLSPNLLELIDSYIYNGNTTKTIGYSSYMGNMAKTRRKLVLDWSDLQANELGQFYDNELLYRILTARGSYSMYCPICADIPFETVDFTDKNKKRHSRRLLILENENKKTREDVPYIITVCCNHCFEKLSNILSNSEFDGTHLVLSTQLAHGLHEKLVNKQYIELSPTNIALMKKMKL